jgi:uncharacterized membrane protein (DUF373 family)
VVEANDQEARAASGAEPAAIFPFTPPPRALWLIRHTEDLVHYVVIAGLVLMAALALYQTGQELFARHIDLGNRVIDGLNGILFVVIVLELMSTVVAHFEHAGFQLQPFLIIGIISGVRHILTVGARLSLARELSGPAFRQSQIELGVEGGLVLALAFALFLIRLREAPQAGELPAKT